MGVTTMHMSLSPHVCVKSHTMKMSPVLVLLTVFATAAVLAADPCGPKSQACCNPSITPPQLCPGGIPCESCGGSSACECPSHGPAPPSPSPPNDSRLTVVNGCNSGPIWIAHIVAGGVGPDPQDVVIPPGGSAQFHTGTP